MLRKLAVAALVATISGTAHAGKTLDTIKQRGELVCGVNTNLAGFSAADSQGNWTGLDVDICKAIAASILGDAKKVKWVPLNASQRFTALQSGEVDILSRNTTWTLTRDASLGLEFTGITYYDGQGFMVPVKSKVTSAKQLKGATVCVQSGTTTEKNLSDYSKANNLGMKPVVFETFEATNKAYFSGRCQAYTTSCRWSDFRSTRISGSTTRRQRASRRCSSRRARERPLCLPPAPTRPPNSCGRRKSCGTPGRKTGRRAQRARCSCPGAIISA